MVSGYIAIITLATLIAYNRPINRFSGEVTVTKTGKTMQAIDCTALIIWMLIIALNPMTDVWNWSGTIVLITMIITAIIRSFSYFRKYLEVEEKMRG